MYDNAGISAGYEAVKGTLGKGMKLSNPNGSMNMKKMIATADAARVAGSVSQAAKIAAGAPSVKHEKNMTITTKDFILYPDSLTALADKVEISEYLNEETYVVGSLMFMYGRWNDYVWLWDK